MRKLLHSQFFIFSVLLCIIGSYNLTAQEASLGYSQNSTFLNIEAECIGTGQIKYDDGTFENGYGWNNTVTDGRYVLKFTPPSYPWNFNTFCVALSRLAAGPASLTFDIIVYDATGAGGAPGALVATIAGQTATNIPIWTTLSWYDYPVNAIPALNSGSYFIGIKFNASTLSGLVAMGADESTTTPLQPGYSWANAGPWNAITVAFPTYKAMGFRTLGGPAAGPGGASNPAPANNAQNIGITGIQLSWTNPAGATSNRVFFGTNPASLTQIHTGSLISSINAPSPLLYNTQYYWRVDEIDGTGTSTGATWTFKTMWDPSIVIEYLVAYDSTLTAGRTSRDSILANLDALGVVYHTFNRGGNSSTSLVDFAPYKTIIWLGEGTSIMANVQRDAMKTYLNSGTPSNKKKLIIFAEDVGYHFGRTASTYLDLDMMNNFLGANFLLDRPASGANQGLIGATVNTGIVDSTIGPWPDVLSVFDPQYGAVLYNFRATPTDANAIGHKRANFEVATFGVDVESLRPSIDSPPGSPVKRFLIGAINYVPVEFVSFTASASQGRVTLNWSTATETNNLGFEIQRRTDNTFQKVGYVPGSGTTTETKSYLFVEGNVSQGTHIYRLKQIDFDGTVNYSPEIEVDVQAPQVFSLDQNYPNPFNPSTTINFGLAVESRVSLKIFDLLGQEVVQLLNSNIAAGSHSVNFDASNLNSGVYFYKIEANGADGTNFVSVKKMMLTK